MIQRSCLTRYLPMFLPTVLSALLLCFVGLLRPDSIQAEEVVVDSVLISVIHSAAVPARDTGVLTDVLVREGDRVDAGALLIKLDPVEAELNLSRATRELEVARLEHENKFRRSFAFKSAEVAASELERALEANKKYSETVSRTEVDRLRLISEKAGLDFQQAEHEHRILGISTELKKMEVEQARHLLERRFIRAPIDGVIVKIEHRIGEWVQPGQCIVRMLDTQQLRAEAVLPGKYRQRNFLQAKVQVTVPGESAEQVIGTVHFVHPEIDPIDGTFRLWAELDNRSQQLRPGDSVQMRIQLSE